MTKKNWRLSLPWRQKTENVSIMLVFKIIYTICGWMNTHLLTQLETQVNTHTCLLLHQFTPPQAEISWYRSTLLNNHYVSLNLVSNRAKLFFSPKEHMFIITPWLPVAADDTPPLLSARLMALHLIGKEWFIRGALLFDLYEVMNHYVLPISSLKKHVSQDKYSMALVYRGTPHSASRNLYEIVDYRGARVMQGRLKDCLRCIHTLLRLLQDQKVELKQ